MDNIFGMVNKKTLSIEGFSKTAAEFEGPGDILEFGTCKGSTAEEIAKLNPHRTIFTIDHFKGLEQTKKRVWGQSGWVKGAFAMGDPRNKWVPKTKQEVYDKLSPYTNVKIIEMDIHQLESPEIYGINNTLVACHVDVDIYEPTVSALNFLQKCKWDKIFMRFDDWHGHDKDFDEHERLAFKEWIDRTEYTYEITHGGVWAGIFVSRNLGETI